MHVQLYVDEAPSFYQGHGASAFVVGARTGARGDVLALIGGLCFPEVTGLHAVTQGRPDMYLSSALSTRCVCICVHLLQC